MATRLEAAKFLSILALASAPAFAQTIPANNYECAGDPGTSVTYSTTSFGGVPLITIQIDKTVISKSGDEIQTQSTVLGNLVTVVRQEVPDQFTDTVTLIAPDVNLIEGGRRAGFATQLALTRTRTSIGGPALVVGVIQESTYRRLFCVARVLQS
jgi:hypothetical protein